LQIRPPQRRAGCRPWRRRSSCHARHVAIDQLKEFHVDARPLLRVLRRPRRLRCERVFDRSAEIGLRGKIHGRLDFARHRQEHLAFAAAGAGDFFAPDEVADLPHSEFSSRYA
jgi:hypothetical protein